jgi:AraC-like DNA-binding protein
VPGSATSGFVEPEHFEAALRADCCLSLVITSRGQFRARLTQIMLHQLRLLSAEEQVPRIALIAVPSDMVLVVLPPVDRATLIWAGISMQTGDLLALGPGQRVYARTHGPCRWGALLLPTATLAEYHQIMPGAALCAAPTIQCWRPPRVPERRLRSLCKVAIRTAGAHPGWLIDAQAAHGLEQQVVEALIECLPTGRPKPDYLAGRPQRDIMLRFEEVLYAKRRPGLRLADLCAVIGVSERTLRAYCQTQLGMGPRRYIHVRRMQLVRRALRNRIIDTANVSNIAHGYGFHDERRFVTSYRALYGELPCTTLHRGTRYRVLRGATRGHA